MLLVDNKIRMEDLRKFIKLDRYGFPLPQNYEMREALGSIKVFCIRKLDLHFPDLVDERREKEYVTAEKLEALNSFLRTNISFCIRLSPKKQITAMMYLKNDFAETKRGKPGWKIFEAALPIAKQYEIVKTEVLF